MTETDPLPSWARGFPLAELKERASIFAEAFGPYVHGAFGMPKENAIADALAAGECIWTRADQNAVQGVALAKHLKSGSRQLDFAGRAATPRAGDVIVRAIAGTDEARSRIIAALAPRGPALWVEDFVEAPHSALWPQLGFERVLTKVMASSDLKGLWLRSAEEPRIRVPAPLDPADWPALAVLAEGWLADGEREAILAELDDYSESLADPEATPWAQHYSSYNKRQSWTAFALHGYDRADPGFIIKPAEMSRKWKAENPERAKAKCGMTLAGPHFPKALDIVARLPGHPQRVRLMRLASGNGELSRHADITDPEAGTADRATARIHIPLASPPECKFLGWGLGGERIERRFPPGALCYLDTRKPHSVINPGAEDRVHLVVDLHSGPELREMIARAAS